MMATKSIHKPDLVGLMLRLPGEIHRLLEASAERNHRSLNSEILFAVSQYLGSEAQAQEVIDRMTAEQRRSMAAMFRRLIEDPDEAARIIKLAMKKEAP